MYQQKAKAKKYINYLAIAKCCTNNINEPVIPNINKHKIMMLRRKFKYIKILLKSFAIFYGFLLLFSKYNEPSNKDLDFPGEHSLEAKARAWERNIKLHYATTVDQNRVIFFQPKSSMKRMNFLIYRTGSDTLVAIR